MNQYNLKLQHLRCHQQLAPVNHHLRRKDQSGKAILNTIYHYGILAVEGKEVRLTFFFCWYWFKPLFSEAKTETMKRWHEEGKRVRRSKRCVSLHMMEMSMIYNMIWLVDGNMISLSSKAKGLPPNKQTIQQSVPSKSTLTKPKDTRYGMFIQPPTLVCLRRQIKTNRSACRDTSVSTNLISESQMVAASWMHFGFGA